MFYTELQKELGKLKKSPYEIIFVNDGSVDASRDLIESLIRRNKNIRLVQFSRNFGHEAAMLAGIENARGDAIICMDCDLQHPPEKISAMLQEHQNGSHVVMMVRGNQPHRNFIKNSLSKLFYYLINKLSHTKFEKDASDFFLISKEVAHIVVHRYTERVRMIRGIVQQVGFKSSSITFEVAYRAAGESKYNYTRLANLFFSTIASFSSAPLRASLVLGVLVSLFGFVVGVYTIAMRIIGEVVPGYTTIVVLLSFFSGIQFILLGILGEYIGFIFTEIKRRPLYIVEEIIDGAKNKKASRAKRAKQNK